MYVRSTRGANRPTWVHPNTITGCAPSGFRAALLLHPVLRRSDRVPRARNKASVRGRRMTSARTHARLQTRSGEGRSRVGSSMDGYGAWPTCRLQFQQLTPGGLESLSVRQTVEQPVGQTVMQPCLCDYSYACVHACIHGRMHGVSRVKGVWLKGNATLTGDSVSRNAGVSRSGSRSGSCSGRGGPTSSAVQQTCLFLTLTPSTFPPPACLFGSETLAWLAANGTHGAHRDGAPDRSDDSCKAPRRGRAVGVRGRRLSVSQS